MGVVRVNGRCGSFVVQWKVKERAPNKKKTCAATWCLQMHAGVGCMCPMINCGAGCVRTVCFVLFMENDTRLPLPLAYWATRSPQKSRAAQWITSSACLAALASLRHGTAVALWLWRGSRTRCARVGLLQRLWLLKIVGDANPVPPWGSFMAQGSLLGRRGALASLFFSVRKKGVLGGCWDPPRWPKIMFHCYARFGPA